jgi:hypothetical protein
VCSVRIFQHGVYVCNGMPFHLFVCVRVDSSTFVKDPPSISNEFEMMGWSSSTRVHPFGPQWPALSRIVAA